MTHCIGLTLSVISIITTLRLERQASLTPSKITSLQSIHPIGTVLVCDIEVTGGYLQEMLMTDLRYPILLLLKYTLRNPTTKYIIFRIA